LFNAPQEQIGQLAVVDGVARRVVRVEVGSRPPDDGPSDVASRFGFDHYYEMEVYTDDSQNYPLVFCMRELPTGFSVGGNLHAPVRVAGFFFKDWLYRTRKSGVDGDAGQPQYAPLLIGRAPLVLPAQAGSGEAARLVGGGLFLLALVVFVAAIAWLARDDRRFRQRTPSSHFSLPPGQSLNDLSVPDTAEPINPTCG
jgi:hypothetical protein